LHISVVCSKGARPISWNYCGRCRSNRAQLVLLLWLI